MAFNVKLPTFNSQLKLPHSIYPKAMELLKVHQFTLDVTQQLHKMNAARQFEAVKLNIAVNTITAAHASAQLKATPPEPRTNYKPSPPEGDLLEQIVKLERGMSQVYAKYKPAEENYGRRLLNLGNQALSEKADVECSCKVPFGAVCARFPHEFRTDAETS